MTQAHIIYSGTVQGVGFRYTVRTYAKNLHLSGWVKNLPDGRVEILAEGEEPAIRVLMELIEKHYEGFIGKKDLIYEPPTGQFNTFEITH